MPLYENIQLFKMFEALGCRMIICSGGGIDYAERWAQKLGLKALIIGKGSIQVDIAFDDEKVNLEKVNIKVHEK